MINTKIFLERFLQKARFKRIPVRYLKGRVLDFGGNEGELKPYVHGTYTLVNYDHSPMANKTFDSIIALAVIEHIAIQDVYEFFKKFKTHLSEGGAIVITTPTPASKPVLEFLAWAGVLDKENIQEHKHYWTKEELYELATLTGFRILRYNKFQFGFNQMCIFLKA